MKPFFNVTFCPVLLITFSSFSFANTDIHDIAKTVHIHHFKHPSLSEIPTDNIEVLTRYLHYLDPHSDYYSDQAYSQLKHQSNEDNKLGVIVSKADNGEFLFVPHKNGPAYSTGLLAPAVFEFVNDQEARNIDLHELNNLVQSSSETRLKGKDAISGKPVQIIVRPTKFTTPLVERIEYKHANVLRVNLFAQTKTFLALRDELTKLQDEQKPLFIDLRYNSGGDLFAAIDCVSLLFAGNNPIASLKYSDTKLTQFRGRSDVIVYHSPFFIIISQLTASAAEIFARALQFYQRAIILGHPSEGKCTSQQYFELPSGDALKLTTAMILSPDGHFCDGEGITPNLQIETNVHDTERLINSVVSLE